MDPFQRSLELHSSLRGKLSVRPKAPLETTDDLTLAYSPGVAEPCRVISSDPARSHDLTVRGNSVAVVTDGSAVLGLGNIGPEAAMPVMEGKAALLSRFAGIDAWPICLDTQDPDEIVAAVRAIAPGFGGINLEDIAAPRCFEIEANLQDLGIPVFHDDQHGTAIVLLAALLNAVKVTGKKLGDLRIVLSGAGAAGTAIASLLRCVGYESSHCQPAGEVIVCDSVGAIHSGREDLNAAKRSLLDYTNRHGREGGLAQVLEGADVFVGVSVAGLLEPGHVRSMAPDPILFALANPVPEIHPDEAMAAGAAVVGTGRSDHPNQVNNLLAFPGIFRGALDSRARQITPAMKLAAAHALADFVSEPTPERVLPSPLDEGVAECVAEAVALAAREPVTAG